MKKNFTWAAPFSKKFFEFLKQSLHLKNFSNRVFFVERQRDLLRLEATSENFPRTGKNFLRRKNIFKGFQ